MENLIIGEKQFQLEFEKKVSLEDYKLMLKALKSHMPCFSSALFKVFSLAIKEKEKTKTRILNLFRKNPKNVSEIRTRISIAKKILLN